MGPVVTIRRDELRLLKEVRDLLLDEVTQLRMQLQYAQLPHQSQSLAR
jgi:hypothetical protein